MIKRPLDKFCTVVAYGFGLGLIPRAPGTWGSLLGLPLGACIYAANRTWFAADNASPLLAHLSATTWIGTITIWVILTGLAWFVIDRTERSRGCHDDPRIVIDEIVGQSICVSMFEPYWLTYAIAFLAFRFFDIAKPSIIGWADRDLPGAWGTLIDDVIAGAVVATLLVGGYEIYIKLL